MCDYSTVYFSVLLLMGVYVVTGFCSWQSQTFCYESSSWSLCNARGLLRLRVPCRLGAVRVGTVNSCQSGACVMAFYCRLSVFLPLWRSRGIPGIDPRGRTAGEVVGRFQETWTLHSTCQFAPRSSWPYRPCTQRGPPVGAQLQWGDSLTVSSIPVSSRRCFCWVTARPFLRMHISGRSFLGKLHLPTSGRNEQAKILRFSKPRELLFSLVSKTPRRKTFGSVKPAPLML